MRQRLFYQLTLLLPLVVPAVLWLVPVEILDRVDHHALVLGPLIESLPIAGAPYAVFAIGMVAWLQRTPNDAMQRLSVTAPLLFLVVFVVWCAVRVGLQRGAIDGGFIRSVAFFGVFVLLVGYFYVAIVEVMRRIGSRRGWISALGDSLAA